MIACRTARPDALGQCVEQLHRLLAVLVGVVIAVGTLLVLEASLPGGMIEGQGTMAYAHTMAFTTLVFLQLFTLCNSRSDVTSAFHGLFSNKSEAVRAGSVGAMPIVPLEATGAAGWSG